MSRLQNIFQGSRAQKPILSVYCTAGYPRLNDTIEVINALQQNGVDIIEIGIPYSDPLADGPVIQKSNALALANGMTIKKLFEQLKGFRQLPGLADTGMILMGYLNPVLQYGFEKFCADAAATGIDGLIIPDLPAFEFENEYGTLLNRFNLDLIFMVTPETSPERVKKLDSLSRGFLYAVSSSSTTGKRSGNGNLETYLTKLKKTELHNPLMVGFGIQDKSGFEDACRLARGAIIGSAYIRALENTGNIRAATRNFISSILG